ncbi:similar to Saccharomyces cerevisiae YHR175W CTR2 Putative low-affinity copper transporter of the vacuolar membrane [Maudiozyma saulgeensis]|uniref:Copper transport protein n=1 Tax=Maudiozyma saulgeensis TaxID=1789683 RepID=A0A1X7R593_9SACH|nr:similar to Saccharomyces cerevisiae YHR175W CTR2 Putative low-affinity copper transporter of the vacuolar membrane [Kazachstania saulgeensis]
MDHSKMNHAMMDHGDMPQGDHESSCSMNMSFTWSYKDTCVVFNWWHIKTKFQFVISCLIVASLATYYEYLRFKFVKYASETTGSNRVSITTNNNSISQIARREKLCRTFHYGIQVGFSFMLMLIFMTYNGWLMLAVVIGAAFGYYRWNDSLVALPMEQRSLACH